VAIGGQLLGFYGGGTPVDTENLSPYELHVIGAMTSGVSPRLPASKREDLARVGAGSLRQIATRDGHAFFVAKLKGGGVCVSVGVLGSKRTLGSIMCKPDFPSPSLPILDQSTFGGSPELTSMTRLEGFAADSVATVAILTSNGSLDAETPVRDNVYSRVDGFPDETVAGIVALDSTGTRLYVHCYARTGCVKG
jgi:hypothetical protein